MQEVGIYMRWMLVNFWVTSEKRNLIDALSCGILLLSGNLDYVYIGTNKIMIFHVANKAVLDRMINVK